MVGKVLFWPLWWYTVGLKQMLTALANNILQEEQRLGVLLWWRNLFVPMFGQYDWQGRLISFIMRLLVGVIRTLLLLLWFALSLLVVFAWIFALPAAAYFFWQQLTYFYIVSWW